jgi:hypothetical protein
MMITIIDKIFLLANNMFAAFEKILSMENTMVSATEKIFSEAKPLSQPLRRFSQS